MHILSLKTVPHGFQLLPVKMDILTDILTYTRVGIRMGLARMGTMSKPMDMRSSAAIPPRFSF